MKAIMIIIINAATIFVLAAQPGFELVLEDNFDSAQLNRAVWDTRYPWGRSIPTNKELQYFTDTGNIYLKDGKLLLIAKREMHRAKFDSTLPDDSVMWDYATNLHTYTFTSGMVSTRQAFHYGKYEIRCKMPKGKGMWPAFWMWSGGHADEIDFFEFRGDKTHRISTGLHPYDSVKYRRNLKLTRYPFKNLTRKFYTITCFWYPEVVIWQVEGKEVFRFTTNYPNQYRRGMPVFANLAVGSGFRFTGPPRKKDKFPRVFEIDYIRIWKLKDQP